MTVSSSIFWCCERCFLFKYASHQRLWISFDGVHVFRYSQIGHLKKKRQAIAKERKVIEQRKKDLELGGDDDGEVCFVFLWMEQRQI